MALEHRYASREDSESPDSWGYLAYPHTWFATMLEAAVGACARICGHCGEQLLACGCNQSMVPDCRGWYHPGNGHACDPRYCSGGNGHGPFPAPLHMMDLGAGIGTKCLAAERAGCTATGIEHDERLVAEAVRLGAHVEYGDVRDTDVSRTDIVFMNCPFRDPKRQTAFEADVAAAMKPGAVLMLGNRAGPAPQGWEQLTTVIERDGAWRKPAA